MEQTIEQRLKLIKDMYFRLDDMMDMLPNSVPDSVKKQVKEIMFEDEEIRRLMQGFEEARPPRFLMVGRTGVGKSSLINAMCSLYTAGVSDVHIGTKGVERYECYDGDRMLMEILDSRGIGESREAAEGERTAEQELMDEILRFKPDAILFVMRCKARDRRLEDIDYVKALQKAYLKETRVKIPIIVVLNQADEMEPSQYKIASEYPHRKLDNIKEAEREFGEVLRKRGLVYSALVPVSSLIDWGYSSKDIYEMTDEERKNLHMELDGRYNIDKLIQKLEKNLEVDASMGLLMAADTNSVLERIAMKFVDIFAKISGVVALSPIPFSDMAVLSTLQVLMITMIGYLAGEKMDMKAAKNFIAGVLGIGFGGNIFKLTARQLSKLIPVAGGMINSGVAYSGTYTMGRMAVQYYIYGIDIKKLKKERKKELKELKESGERNDPEELKNLNDRNRTEEPETPESEI